MALHLLPLFPAARMTAQRAAWLRSSGFISTAMAGVPSLPPSPSATAAGFFFFMEGHYTQAHRNKSKRRVWKSWGPLGRPLSKIARRLNGCLALPGNPKQTKSSFSLIKLLDDVPSMGDLFRIFRVYSRLFVLYNYAAFPVKSQVRYSRSFFKNASNGLIWKRNFHLKIQGQYRSQS